MLDLTPRERELLAYLVEDTPFKQIADKMNLSLRTAKFHASSLYQKYKVSGRMELCKHVRENGAQDAYKEDMWERLTEFEKKITILSALDFSQKEIGRRLGTSESKIGYAIRMAYRVLNVNGRLPLALYLQKFKLLDDSIPEAQPDFRPMTPVHQLHKRGVA